MHTMQATASKPEAKNDNRFCCATGSPGPYGSPIRSMLVVLRRHHFGATAPHAVKEPERAVDRGVVLHLLAPDGTSPMAIC